MKIDLFIVYLLLSILIAFLFPQLAIYQDGTVLDGITSVGVGLIFFFYGLKLSFEQIKSGLKNWRLHILVQSATFLIFPILVLLFKPFVGAYISEHSWLGFFFLAALPSTVSSSVVMVSLAKGNIPAAIFNASISGLLGVLITPLWMSLFLDFTTENVLLDVYVGLMFEIILPVIAGLFLQKYWGTWAKNNNKHLSNFDKTVILLIVYGSFAKSFDDGIFKTLSAKYLLGLFLAVVFLFILVYVLLFIVGNYIFRFNREDQITLLFCGSKKSLTHGSVFGKFIFMNNPYMGLYFLPLMVYHAFQIFVITFIAQRYHNKSAK
ncbi:bile acid:sodium symporter family protein [Sphingobacterium bovistauri]|uniref:Bile acid:sodium symporter n=1 Tax=Sphingobacterium bovistauri TaxID=2781959 RepID=A0ABS7ZAY6_9SPHI|nr:bile acid:sodium symporter family protein [Sphingobacterium bovistauri]MCA5006762.1 bile acid:sodium symporter [Sphingobacterium bovistauri]